MPSSNPLTKKCSRCGFIKSVEQFPPRKDRASGYQSACRQCINKRSRELNAKPRIERTEKQCVSCKQVKSIHDFSLKNTRLDGHRDACKECIKKQNEKLDAKMQENYLKGIQSGEEKTCSKCNQKLPLIDFHYSRNACKTCENKRKLANERKNLERKQARDRASRQRLKEQDKHKVQQKIRIRRLANQYNMTPEEYDQMVLAQNNLCAICGKPPKEGRKLYIDHCHKTGLVRELLCQKCNSMIGYGNDDPIILANAFEYLKKHLN